MADYILYEQARGESYNLFSALFCQPETEVLDGNILFDKLKASFKILGLESNSIDSLSLAYLQYSTEELVVEYAKLFVGPFKTLAPPYSAIYLGSRTVMSDDTLWVLNQYRRMGLDFKPEIRDLPDHITVEFEYMYYLIFHEIQAIERTEIKDAKSYYAAQEVFLFNHINKWVPVFCDHALKQTQNLYFKCLFSLTKEFVNQVKLSKFPESFELRE